MLKTLSVAVLALSSVLSVNGVQATSGLDEQERLDLLFMREEEQLARDVYLVLGDQWDLRVFNNIARSEQRHMDSVGNLLNFYGLEDPLDKEVEVGVFENQEIQTMYDQLVAKGSLSEVNALEVGKQIEELDIKDLKAAVEQTDEVEILQVYNRLLRGSYNHLAAFNRLLGEASAQTKTNLEGSDQNGEEKASHFKSREKERSGGRGPGFGKMWGRS